MRRDLARSTVRDERIQLPTSEERQMEPTVNNQQKPAWVANTEPSTLSHIRRTRRALIAARERLDETGIASDAVQSIIEHIDSKRYFTTMPCVVCKDEQLIEVRVDNDSNVVSVLCVSCSLLVEA